MKINNHLGGIKLNKCDRCGKTYRDNGMVTISDSQGKRSETICGNCYNKEMAESLGIEDFKAFNPNIEMIDCEGIKHNFEIRKMIHGTGVLWEAIEFLDDKNIGYSFEIYQGFEDDSVEAVVMLQEKVKEGLSKKFIKKTIFRGYQSLTLSEDVLAGKIEWDDDYNGRIPKFKVDGKEYSAEQIGQILMGYEGWNFELKIKEPTD